MNILERIVEVKRREVERLPDRRVTPDVIRAEVTGHGPRRDFVGALRHPRFGVLGLIAEVKKASPSAGVICPDFDPVRTARAYEAAGASCLSVLTDETFFQGSLAHLRAIRQAVELPLLRKDFMIDARQIVEAAEWGADAILLIAAILSDEDLSAFHALAVDSGMAALVEVHDEVELDRALAVGATLIGVNNRDLKTFQVDLGTTERLAARLARAGRLETLTLVGESGIHTGADVSRLEAAGARGILVGESLMRHPDPTAKIHELLATNRED